LGALVQSTLNLGSGEEFGIVVKNLKTGERYYFNEHKLFETASLYKLWVMATTYGKIEDGSLNEGTVLAEDVSVLNDTFDISSESAELTEGSVSWPVINALQQMITISDNYSALLLTKKIGVSSIRAFLSDNGFNESKLGTGSSGPTSTPFDISLFFEKLYRLELAPPSYTEEMVGLLKEQKKNEKLPKYLPEDIVSAHKTGELGAYSHDAGIVYTSNGDYIFIAMSKSSSQVKANEQIAEVSKVVYNYFVK
jgi:beta-lactamase class A